MPGLHAQVYTEGATAEGLLQHLQRLQASPNPREQAVAKCMIFNLFDEYRFFNKYPDKELHITAVLFSGLVRLRLVQGQQLDTVLRLILDALRQPPGSKLFDFARETLRHGQDALLAWPHYCSHLLQARPTPALRCRGITPAGLGLPWLCLPAPVGASFPWCLSAVSSQAPHEACPYVHRHTM